MTARVTTLKGATAGAYYLEALPSYYLDSSEPPGRWHGHGADRLDLTGAIAGDSFLAVMAGLDPSGEFHLGRRYGDTSVRGFDVTASAPKSVSTLFALGDADVRTEVLEAHDTAVAILIDWVESRAHTRFRVNGQVAVVDAEGIIAATFRQHTSRALDPQLHTHVVIANRVVSPDGRWLALDARSLKLDQRTLSGIYHATLRSELTARLGLEWRDVTNGVAEAANIPDAILGEFSSRTRDVARRLDIKIDRFTDNLDTPPTARERWRLERESVLETRPAKSHGHDPESLHADWHDRTTALGLAPSQVVANTRGRVMASGMESLPLDQITADAMAALSEKQSTWRPAEVTRELAAAIPANVSLDPRELTRLLEELTQAIVEQGCVDLSRPVPTGVPLRRDGRPITESIADRVLTTPAILQQEERLLVWAQERLAVDATESTAAPKRSRHRLTAAQAQVAHAVAGDGPLVLVVGPAGTGKTTALAPAVAQLDADGRPVFGLAPSATAAAVLADATGLEADTIDKLLVEHAGPRPPQDRYQLPAGTTLVVDEAGMIPTDRLASLAHLADQLDWRVVLIGDPQQFAAVGRGGMYSHLIGTSGHAIELDTVMRFANSWERDASLRLRRGDPDVAAIYDAHDRLHGGTTTRMRDAAVDAWNRHRRDGQTVALSAPTNDAVVGLNQAAQQQRIVDGELSTRGPSIGTGTYRLHPGDEIVTRRNDRQLRTDRNHMIRNRDTFTITNIGRQGDLAATGTTGTVRLPSAYVQQHVELAYAQTSHATQGRTVDHSILVLDTPCDLRGIYVPLTRGRDSNEAFVTLHDDQTATDVIADSVTRSWIDRPAVSYLPAPTEVEPESLSFDGGQLQTLFEERSALVARYRELEREITGVRLDDDDFQREIRELGHTRDRRVSSIERSQAFIDQHTNPISRYRHRHAMADNHGHIDSDEAAIADIDQQVEHLQIERHEFAADRRTPNLRREQKQAHERLDTLDQELIDDAMNRVLPDQAADLTDDERLAAGRIDQHSAAYPTTSNSSGHQQSLELVEHEQERLRPPAIDHGLGISM